jgi:hypothetical protein
MQRIRKKLTYANVVATLALFLVLSGGAAYAAGHLSKNSVGVKQLKKNAVSTAKIRNGAVTSAKLAAGAVGRGQLGAGAVGSDQLADGSVTAGKIAPGAVTGSDVDLASLGQVPNATNSQNSQNSQNAQNSQQLGGVPASGYQAKLDFAVVSVNNKILKVVRGNATGAKEVTKGVYSVSFPSSIAACALLATLGDSLDGSSEGGEISVELKDTIKEPNVAEVRTYDDNGAPVEPMPADGFHLAVICP